MLTNKVGSSLKKEDLDAFAKYNILADVIFKLLFQLAQHLRPSSVFSKQATQGKCGNNRIKDI